MSSRDKKVKNISKFHPDSAITGIQLETKENLSMNVVNQYGDKRNGFVEVPAFCLRLAGILIDFYYKELIEIGAKSALSVFGNGPNM